MVSALTSMHVLIAAAGAILAKATPVAGWWGVFSYALASLGIALTLVVAVVLLCEDYFVFHPTREPLDGWTPPTGAENCTFRTRDGLVLHGWWHPGVDGEGDPAGRPVLLWCHGNAGNVTYRAENLLAFAHAGFAVFIFDYRGYGRSAGQPCERGLYEDGESAYRYLTEEHGVAAERIVCLGRSLGSAVALHVALRNRVAGVILEGALENVSAVARARFPILPVWPLLRNRFDTIGRVPYLRVPLMVVHAARDEVVPLAQGRAVYAAARTGRQFHLVEGAMHNDTHIVGGPQYYTAFRRFAEECVAAARAAQTTRATGRAEGRG